MVAEAVNRTASAGRRVFLLDASAFFFVLAAPYLSFATHNGFVAEVANLVVLAGLLALAVTGALILRRFRSGFLRVSMLSCLVLVFADAQFTGGLVVLLITTVAFLGLLRLRDDHRALVVAVVFSAMTTATVIQVLLNENIHQPFLSGVKVDVADSVSAGRPITDLPVHVHIVLDGQLGIDGFDDAIPVQKAVKSAALKLFSKYGFRVFTRAYSPYDKTELSMSAALNAGAITDQRHLYSSSKIPHSYRLDQNRYFDRLGALGYRINVFQATFMDYCSGAQDSVTYCESYDQSAVSSESTAGFTLREKVGFILSIYSDLLLLKRQIARLYAPIRRQLSAHGIEVPQWRIHHLHRIGPLAVLPVMDRVTARVATAGRGKMFFAHLMMPHEPYAVGPSCEIRRPVVDWPTRVSRSWDGGEISFGSAQARLSIYRVYVDQVRCILSRIERLLAKLDEAGTLTDSTIIIHGDHGSRLSRLDPSAQNSRRLSRQDYVDTFSTLFAVRSPGLPTGTDNRIASVPELLRSTVLRNDAGSAGQSVSSRRVYLRKRMSEGSGNFLCRVVPASWLQSTDAGFLEPLRRWSKRECTHISTPVYKEVEEVILTETWEVVR